MRQSFLLIVLFYCSFILQAIQLDGLLTKPVNYYYPLKYKSDTQVWGIDRGDADDIYFATNEGVVLFDGIRWERYSTPSESILRSVLYDSDSKVLYSGGVNEIGCWRYDDTGHLKYKLIYKNQPKRATEDYWRIAKIDREPFVYFQSSSALMAYNPTTGKIYRFVDGASSNHYLFVVGDKIYLQQENKLFRIEGLRKKIVSTALDSFFAIYIEGTADGGLILYSSEKGCIVLNREGKLISRESFHPDLRITSMARLGPDLLVGTGNTGFFRISEDGKIRSKVGEEMGLKNTVLSVAPSRNGDIWLGLNGGIAKIEEGTRGESYLYDANENIGYVYCAINYNGALYVGTNKGLYRVERGDYLSRFVLVPEFKGQVWNLYQVGSDLIVTHNKGIFAYNGVRIRELKHGGVYTIERIPSKPGFYISGNNKGFSLYQVVDNKLQYKCDIAGFSDLVQSCKFDKDGNLWMPHGRREYHRLRFSPDFTKVTIQETYPVPTQESKHAFGVNVGDGFAFLNNEGKVYTYNDLSNTLEADEYLTTLFAPINRNIQKIQSYYDRFWEINEEGVCMLHKNENKVEVLAGFFAGVCDKFIPKGFRRIIQLGDSLYGIGLANGMGILNLAQVNGNTNQRIPNLKKVEVIGNDGSSFVKIKGDHIDIPPHTSIINFWLTSLNKMQRVEYRIDGADDKWEVVSGGYVQLPYLRPGNYSVKLRSSNGFGAVSEVKVVKLHVAAPWYASTLAWIFYVLLFGCGIYAAYRAMMIKAKRKQSEICMIEERRLKEEMDQFKLYSLQKELGDKDSKIMSITMLSIQNNTFLKKIKDSMLKIDASESPAVKQQISRIAKEIEHQLNDSTSWDSFAENFNHTFDGFFDRLLERHPKLTNSDLRLCAYIRMNLTTKEIAMLRNVSPSSIEMAKYRLRKKLELSESIALPNYLSELGIGKQTGFSSSKS